MTSSTTPNKSMTTSQTSPKPNGSTATDHPDQADVASTSPTPSAPTAPEKKPITVLVSEQTHRKVKITAELSGVSLSDLVEAQLKILVKNKLPALLAGLDAEG